MSQGDSSGSTRLFINVSCLLVLAAVICPVLLVVQLVNHGWSTGAVVLAVVTGVLWGPVLIGLVGYRFMRRSDNKQWTESGQQAMQAAGLQLVEPDQRLRELVTVHPVWEYTCEDPVVVRTVAVPRPPWSLLAVELVPRKEADSNGATSTWLLALILPRQTPTLWVEKGQGLAEGTVVPIPPLSGWTVTVEPRTPDPTAYAYAMAGPAPAQATLTLDRDWVAGAGMLVTNLQGSSYAPAELVTAVDETAPHLIALANAFPRGALDRWGRR